MIRLKRILFESVQQEIGNIPMYRGARDGNPERLTGPSFFISEELFAKTYGKTAAFKLDLRNPKMVSDSEWMQQYGGGSDWQESAAELISEGYDSAVNIRNTPKGKMYVVFLADPKHAKLWEQGAA